MDTIVVGVDTSPAADAALSWALGEAAVRHGRVIALMACDFLNQPRTTDDPDFDPDFTRADARRVLQRVVDRVVEQVGDAAAAVDIELRVAFDLPVRALLEASRAADLVVVGSRGLGGFTGLMLGSVSQQVVTHAQCPVVVHR